METEKCHGSDFDEAFCLKTPIEKPSKKPCLQQKSILQGKKFSEQLLSSIKNKENEKVEKFLESAILFHTVDDSKSTLLHYAAQYGNADLATYLLDRLSQIEAKDSSGRTPLEIAVLEKQREAIKILLNAGASIRFFSKEEFEPNHRLAFLEELQKICSSSEELAKKLIDIGCQLHQVLFIDDAKMIEIMLEKGIPVDSVYPPAKMTALHFAALYEFADIVEVLLKYGADAKAMDFRGQTPLFYVYRYDHSLHTKARIKILQLLLQHVSPTSITPDGFFQARYTLIYGNREAVRLVLQTNPDFSLKQKANDRTVLLCLTLNKNPGIAQELKRYSDQMDVNVVDKKGKTPLFYAVIKEQDDMVDFLLEQGAKTDLKYCRRRSTPPYYAYARQIKRRCEDKHIRNAELFLKHDVDSDVIFNELDCQKITVFEVAEVYKRLNIRTKPVLAHLALLQALHGSKIIPDTIRYKINSHLVSKIYFDSCRALLQTKVSGSVTFFKLLAYKAKRIDSYVVNKLLIEKLEDIFRKYDVKSKYSYFYNILEKRFTDAIERKKSRRKTVAFDSKLFEECDDKTNLVTTKVINCLDYDSIWALCQI